MNTVCEVKEKIFVLKLPEIREKDESGFSS